MVAATMRVVLDTNVLVSSAVYGGKPQEIVELIIIKQITGVISLPLLVELIDILVRKFNYIPQRIYQVERKIRKNFEFVQTAKTLNIARDRDDNRVLEAAVEGECDFIITGDQDLLALGKYGKIKIITPAQFLDLIEET